MRRKTPATAQSLTIETGLVRPPPGRAIWPAIRPGPVRAPRDAAVARKIGPGRSLLTAHPGEQGRLASMSVSHLYSTTSTRTKTGPLTVGGDEGADERLTGSLLWPIRPTWTIRGCQAHSQGLSRLDPATRTHRPSVLSCTRGKPEGARACSGSLNAGIAPSQSTGPETRQPAQRFQRAQAGVSKVCCSLPQLVPRFRHPLHTEPLVGPEWRSEGGSPQQPSDTQHRGPLLDTILCQPVPPSIDVASDCGT